MSLKPEVLDALLAAGATAEMIVAAVKADMADEERRKEEKRSKDAARQRKSRSNRRPYRVSRDVTVTDCDPPIDNIHTPPVSSDDETTSRPSKPKPTGKPEGVRDQVWADFRRLRDKLRAPITETALAGIQREAAKVGWTMDAALAECVERSWRGFKAEWVQPSGAGPPGTSDDFLQHVLRRQAQGSPA